MKQLLFSIIFLIILISSCKHSALKSKAVVIGNDIIYIDEIDNIIKHQLYDMLMKIYSLRTEAINVIIRDNLIEKEAKKSHIKVDQLLKEKIENKITQANIQKYIDDNMIEGSIPVVKGGILRYVSINNPEGKNILIENLRNQLINKYIDSLKNVYNVDILLKAPKSLSTNLSDVKGYYKGNLTSKVTLMIISDLDCFKCREEDSLYENIYNQYKDKIRFGFTMFTEDVSPSSIAAECAGLQGKFWEMKKEIVGTNYFADSIQLTSFARKINLDVNRFKRDFNDIQIRRNLESNTDVIKSAGFYGTPSVAVNNKVVSNVFSEKDIIELIEKELNKY